MSANSIPNPPVITINRPEEIYWQQDSLLIDPVADALADIYSFLLRKAAQRQQQEVIRLVDKSTVTEHIKV